jgi:hypothetical protein
MGVFWCQVFRGKSQRIECMTGCGTNKAIGTGWSILSWQLLCGTNTAAGLVRRRSDKVITHHKCSAGVGSSFECDSNPG